MTLDIEQIKRDREAGTSGDWFWRCEDEPFSEWSLAPGVLIAGETDGTPAGDIIDQANARRIARVPELEEVVIELTAERDALKAEVARLREAVQSAIYAMSPVKDPALSDPTFQGLVDQLADNIGYGAMMSAAEAGWRKSLGDFSGGEFVCGPCRSQVDHMMCELNQALKGGAE